MAEDLAIDRKRTAVMIMDYQQMIVDFYGGGSEPMLQRAAALAKAARETGVPVIYIVVGFRPGYPEVSARNRRFTAIKQSGQFGPDDKGAQIHPLVAPQPGDIIVTKHRAGPFQSTDLEMILRAHDVDTLVLAGIATSGVVLSTVRYAADADYRLIVVRDCCADRDPEVHRVLLDKVFPGHAAVVEAEQVIASLRKS